MFMKKDSNEESIQPGAFQSSNDYVAQKTNTILKGSKLTGDINVSCDMELSGEVEGNINSDHDSNIVIQGICKGNIRTKGGDVSIDGELNSGDITAGGDIKIKGKFIGGKAEARGRIYINGEFDGKFEGDEIEIGANAKGKGEFLYNENISISKGAKVDVQINQSGEKSKPARKPADMKVINMDLPAAEKSG